MVGAPACGDVMALQIKVSRKPVSLKMQFRPTVVVRPLRSSLVTEWVGETLDRASEPQKQPDCRRTAATCQNHCSIGGGRHQVAVDDTRKNILRPKPAVAALPGDGAWCWLKTTNRYGCALHRAAARYPYLSKRGKGVGVRLGVKTTGCSGWPPV